MCWSPSCQSDGHNLGPFKVREAPETQNLVGYRLRLSENAQVLPLGW